MIDLIIIVILMWAAFLGWRDGFIKQLISLGGFLVGFIIAVVCYHYFGKYSQVNGSFINMVTSIIAFLLLWIAVPIILGQIANTLTKALHAIKLSWINSITGMLVSIIKYMVLLSCAFNAMMFLHILNKEKTKESKLFEPTKNFIAFAFHNVSFNNEDHKIIPTLDTIWVDMKKANKTNKL